MADTLRLEPVDGRGITGMLNDPNYDHRWRATAGQRTWFLPNSDAAARLLTLNPSDRLPYITEHYEEQANAR